MTQDDAFGRGAMQCGVEITLHTRRLIAHGRIAARLNAQEQQKLVMMHWDIMKLLSLGVDEHFLRHSGISPVQARDLLKGLLYLRERYGVERDA